MAPLPDASPERPSAMFLSLRGVTKRFGEVTAVENVDLDIAEGEFVCFLGPSGCGKTTLLRLVAGLEALSSGQILLNGEDLTALPARRRNFGVVFQSYSLFPNMTVARNVAYGLECRKWPRAETDARVREMLDLVHLGAHRDKHPHELSGGMQQRVALARALAPRPAVLLLDEPLSALDAKVRESLRGEIRDVQQRLGITTIMVTHDQDEAMEMADRIVVMNRGRIEQVGSADTLYWEPETRFVGEFIGRINIIEAPGRPARRQGCSPSAPSMSSSWRTARLARPCRASFARWRSSVIPAGSASRRPGNCSNLSCMAGGRQ